MASIGKEKIIGIVLSSVFTVSIPVVAYFVYNKTVPSTPVSNSPEQPANPVNNRVNQNSSNNKPKTNGSNGKTPVSTINDNDDNSNSNGSNGGNQEESNTSGTNDKTINPSSEPENSENPPNNPNVNTSVSESADDKEVESMIFEITNDFYTISDFTLNDKYGRFKNGKDYKNISACTKVICDIFMGIRNSYWMKEVTADKVLCQLEKVKKACKEVLKKVDIAKSARYHPRTSSLDIDHIRRMMNSQQTLERRC